MNEEKKTEDMVMAPTAWIDGELPTNGYLDAMTPEERAEQAKIQDGVVITTSEAPAPTEGPVDVAARIVPPHSKISREVTAEDLKRIIVDAYVLRDLCFAKNGLFISAYAMAHPQIDAVDPLNFFVMNDGRVIVNPKITNHTKHTVDSQEACMTFPNLDQRVVQRYNKIDVDFQSIEGGEEEPKLTEVMHVSLSGKEAKIFQHEISHLLGSYIFGDDLTKPDLGYQLRNNGGGIIVNKELEVNKK